MGTVWAATHTVTRARVALKLLDARISARAEMRERFVAEARAASAIDHPNVIHVHDVFELDDGTPVMVLDLLEGETLAARLARVGRMGQEATAAVMIPVIDAVMAAHRLGIVHRDLKPDNVFLASAEGGDMPKVLDFGIAKLLDEEDGRVVTGTGTMLGTPGYMSPEQGFGEKDIDARADVWALGVMLYECLSGIRPVEGDNLGQYLKRLMSDAITPLDVLEPELPAGLLRTVARMLAVDRADRLDDLDTVRAALAGKDEAAAPASEPPHASEPSAAAERVAPSQPRARGGWGLPAVAALLALATGAWWLGRDDEPELDPVVAPAAPASATATTATATPPPPPSALEPLPRTLPSSSARPLRPSIRASASAASAPPALPPPPPPSATADPGGLVEEPPF